MNLLKGGVSSLNLPGLKFEGKSENPVFEKRVFSMSSFKLLELQARKCNLFAPPARSSYTDYDRHDPGFSHFRTVLGVSAQPQETDNGIDWFDFSISFLKFAFLISTTLLCLFSAFSIFSTFMMLLQNCDHELVFFGFCLIANGLFSFFAYP
jgi:hypothetical protein